METRRTRSTRAGPASTAPEATGPARNTRQRGASEEPTASKRPSTRSDTSKGGGELTKNPVPRRGARPSVAASIASSIPTNPGEDDDDEDGDDVAVTSSPPAPEDADGDEYRDASGHMLSSDRQFLMFNIINLAKAAEVIIKRTRAVIDGGASEFQQKILALKLKGFRDLHDLYELPGGPSPFLSFAWTKNDDMSPEQTRAAEVALVLANLAVALNFIKVISSETQGGTHGMLELLVTVFPNLFIHSGSNGTHSENEAMLAVQLRTNCLIESIHSCKTKQAAYEATAAMFCSSGATGSVAERIANGPFKTLARDANSAADNQLCSDRATSIIAHITRSKKEFGVPGLRKAYPLEDTLSSLQQWILVTHRALGRDIAMSQAAWKEMHAKPDEFFDAEGTPPLPDSSDDDSSSEDDGPITRIQSNGESQKTLFRSKEDLKHLMARRATPSPSHRKRTHSQQQGSNEDDDDDEEEEDNFQTDYREPNPEHLAAAQEFKRQRIALASPQQPGGGISHTQLEPPSSGPTAIAYSQPLTSPPSTAQDLRQIASLKERASKDHRAAQQQQQQAKRGETPASIAGLQVRHRVPWSDADSLALIRLIGDKKKEITYADMEKHHADKFEYPRNQLAYRDRARNMKVDYLITDCVLPEGFDRVVLGKKEVLRVVSFGKNPNRKVNQVDADGVIFNNELDMELHSF